MNAIFSECNNVAFGNNLWVAVGQGRNTDSFATSTDGIIWTPRGGKNGLFDWYGKNVKYGKDKLGMVYGLQVEKELLIYLQHLQTEHSGW